MDTTEPRDATSAPTRPTRVDKPRKAPPGWVAPGPPGSTRVVPLEPDEELSWLAGDWRIVQRRDGHRWSLDDLVTAWVAQVEGRALQPPPAAILDLGTGIGSVALMLAWSFPAAHVTGVEAQAMSFGMAKKSVVANAAEARVTLVHADLRDTFFDGAATFDLVTGTPPYFDDPAQTRSRGVQKGPCRFEERGSIVDYLAAMQRVLAPAGRAVICHASRHRARVLSALAGSGLVTYRRLEVLPKAGREPLVDVFALRRAPADERGDAPWERLTVRDEHDQWTPAMSGVRLALGMPPRR